MGHFKTAWITLKDMKNNLRIFLPDLGFFALFSILAFLFATYIGMDVANLFRSFFIEQTFREDLFGTFVEIGVLKSIISLAIFFIFSFVIGSAVVAWKYLVIKAIVTKKKVSLRKAWKEKDRYVWKVILLRFFIYALGLGVLLVGGILVALNLWMRGFMSGTIPTTITTIFMVALILFYRLAIMFALPKLFLQKRNPLRTIISSINACIRNLFYTLKVWLLIFLIGIGYSMIYSSVKIYIQMLNTLPTGGFLFYVMPTIVIILLFAISLIYNLWSEMFAFRSYKNLK
jgi:hypothetical protein